MTRRNKQTKEVQDVNAFMHEVESAMHKEQLLEFWQKHKVAIVASVVVLFSGFTGYKVYTTQAEQNLLDEANAYYAAYYDNKGELSSFETSDALGVKLMATMAEVSNLAKEGNVKDAMLKLDGIALNESYPLPYRHLARVNKAELELAVDVESAIVSLNGLVSEGTLFLPTVLELLGYAYEKQGEEKRARAMFQQIVDMGAKAPTGTANRAQQRLNQLSAS